MQGWILAVQEYSAFLLHITHYGLLFKPCFVALALFLMLVQQRCAFASRYVGLFQGYSDAFGRSDA